MTTSSLTSRTCNSTNTELVDQSSFWSNGSVHWDAHRIGWAVAGSMALLTVAITTLSVTKHCRHYHSPLQQRQIVRILLLPAVYAVISFFSYRYFRSYTYYTLVESVYEAFAIAAFLFLLVQYIGDTTEEQKEILSTKDKRKVPIPFCCWRYRPSKPYFLQTLKWSVLQYCIFRPVITIVSIVCEALDVLCPEQYSVYFAQLYLEIFDFIVFSVALYGLFVFYAVTKDQLKGRSPLSKFLTIKGVVFVTFYQGFVFRILQNAGTIHDTKYWTATNVADGLQALCTTVEMVIFAFIMCFTFSWKPYAAMSEARTPSTRAFLHSQNYADFVLEIWASLVFYWDYWRGKPGTSSKHYLNKPGAQPGGLDFGGAYDYNEAGHPYGGDAYTPAHAGDSLEMQAAATHVDQHQLPLPGSRQEPETMGGYYSARDADRGGNRYTRGGLR